MEDIIYRQDAIDIMLAALDDDWEPDYAKDRMCELPSADLTLYGYRIEHLVMIATVMQKKNVTPEKAIEYFTEIREIVQMILDEQKEIIKKAVEGL